MPPRCILSSNRTSPCPSLRLSSPRAPKASSPPKPLAAEDKEWSTRRDLQGSAITQTRRRARERQCEVRVRAAPGLEEVWGTSAPLVVASSVRSAWLPVVVIVHSCDLKIVMKNEYQYQYEYQYEYKYDVYVHVLHVMLILYNNCLLILHRRGLYAYGFMAMRF